MCLFFLSALFTWLADFPICPCMHICFMMLWFYCKLLRSILQTQCKQWTEGARHGFVQLNALEVLSFVYLCGEKSKFLVIFSDISNRLTYWIAMATGVYPNRITNKIVNVIQWIRKKNCSLSNMDFVMKQKKSGCSLFEYERAAEKNKLYR